jgi:hypothetical protein
MHKSRTKTTFVFLASTLVMLAVIPFLNNNAAMAQGYYDDSYSTYPTDDKKYECRTGPFEGFFVGSVDSVMQNTNSMIEKIIVEIIKQEHKVHKVHKESRVYKEESVLMAHKVHLDTN